MTSRDELADAVVAEARRRRLSEPKPMLFDDAEIDADRAAIAAARELALPLIESVRRYLDDGATRILDIYAAADEWEIVIGWATETAFRHGIDIKPEVLDYAEEIDDDVVAQLRRRFAGAV